MHRLLDKSLVSRLALVALLGLAFAVSAQAESAMEIARDQNSNWNRLYNDGKHGELAQLYAENALISPANGEVIEGRAAIQEFFQGLGGGDNLGIHNHRLDIIKAEGKGDWLYEIAKWRATGAPKNAVMPLYQGIATIIFRRTDAGEWRIHSHTWNQKPQ